MYTYLSSNWLQENDATHPTYISGPMDTQKSRYSSPVDHRSLDGLWPQITRWSVHKYIHNVTNVMCSLYVRCALSVLQKECRKVWGARYRSENTVHQNQLTYLILTYQLNNWPTNQQVLNSLQQSPSWKTIPQLVKKLHTFYRASSSLWC